MKHFLYILACLFCFNLIGCASTNKPANTYNTATRQLNSNLQQNEINKCKDLNSIPGLISFGNYYKQKALYNNALNCYEKVLNISPNNYDVSLSVITIYLNNLYQPQKAIPYIKNMIKNVPSSVTMHYHLCIANTDLGKYNDAIKACSHILTKYPSHIKVLSELGYIEILNNKYQNAIDYFNSVIKIDAGSGDSYYNLGLIYSRQGKYDKSLKNLKKAEEINPEKADTHKLLSTVYSAIGKGALAQKHKELSLSKQNYLKGTGGIQAPKQEATPGTEMDIQSNTVENDYNFLKVLSTKYNGKILRDDKFNTYFYIYIEVDKSKSSDFMNEIQTNFGTKIAFKSEFKGPPNSVKYLFDIYCYFK